MKVGPGKPKKGDKLQAAALSSFPVIGQHLLAFISQANGQIMTQF
jgi:hypothetical protein